MLIPLLLGGIINFISATTRYIYGTTWRSLADAKKYSFKEYLHGRDTNDQIDIDQHIFVNKIVGMISLLGILYLIGYFVNLFY